MYKGSSIIHKEIIKILKRYQATYASPLNSETVGQELNVTPSYIREQAKALQIFNIIGVRKGRGGGYYLKDEFLDINEQYIKEGNFEPDR